MLKEYLHEAVSLLTEAVLGKPVQASAGCPYQECTGWVYDPCHLYCGAYERRGSRLCHTVDPCFGYTSPWWQDTKCFACG